MEYILEHSLHSLWPVVKVLKASVHPIHPVPWWSYCRTTEVITLLMLPSHPMMNGWEFMIRYLPVELNVSHHILSILSSDGLVHDVLSIRPVFQSYKKLVVSDQFREKTALHTWLYGWILNMVHDMCVGLCWNLHGHDSVRCLTSVLCQISWILISGWSLPEVTWVEDKKAW